ncbi:MAG: bifunctional diaminohydroxyphosphoribosylaminopyrimidine deaminase/5-amino-6-(5-phosphoribosylamino)uracil reductase RibD [Leptospirillum sp.]
MTNLLPADRKWMNMVLALARKGEGSVAPNPCVGAVVVSRGKLVGKGFHQRPGLAHAEVCALAQAGPKAMGADLYVNLEPCCHLKKRTPPCTREIIQSGIQRVVISTLDPNPEVSGGGVKELQRAGIEVVVGVFGKKAFEMNRGFFSLMKNRRPFVTLKGAASIDGRIATSSGDSQWISGEKSLLLAHRLRNDHDAILVGVGTILSDDPLLTTRIPGRKTRNPVRIILDSAARTPVASQVIRTLPDAPVLIVTGQDASPKNVSALESAGATVIGCHADPAGNLNLNELMGHLLDRHILTLLVEGGGHVTGSFLAQGLVDRIRLVLAPLVIGGDDAINWVSGGRSPVMLKDALRFPVPIRPTRLGKDVLLSIDLWDEKTMISEDSDKEVRHVLGDH